MNEVDVSDKPSWIQAFGPLPDSAFDRFRATARKQLREGTALDRAIGAIIASLDPGQLANTVIIYCSDNGLFYGEHRAPFQGIAKNNVYDVAMRVPLVVRGPGFPPGGLRRARDDGRRCHRHGPRGHRRGGGAAGDGVDLADVVANPGSYTDRQLLHDKGTSISWSTAPAAEGITTATRKLFRYPSATGTDRFEAYDLDTDPDELDNWANDPARLTERNDLEAALEALLAAP